MRLGETEFDWVAQERPPVVVIDFDGVITDQTGWLGEGIFGPIKEGSKEYINRLKEDGWCVVIWTCRQVTVALLKHLDGFCYDSINTAFWYNPPCSSSKPFADVYLDNRSLFALGWDWDWEYVYKVIRQKFSHLYDAEDA